MSDSAVLTIAVCTYNRSEGLAQTLEKIVAAQPPRALEVEILVINNNSTDDTEAVIAHFQVTDSRVRGVFERKQGLSNARNAAIVEARGAYIAFTDDDVLVDERWLCDLARVIAEESPGCVGGKVLPVWEEGKPDWLGPEFYPMLALLDFHVDRVALDIPKLWGANLCIDKAMAVTLGGFSTRTGRSATMLCSGEDTEFVIRAIAAGYRVIYDPKPTVWHRIGADRVKKGYFRKWWFDTARCQGHTGRGEGLGRSLRGLVRWTLSPRTWFGNEKTRLLNQLDWMKSAGGVIGSIEGRLGRGVHK